MDPMGEVIGSSSFSSWNDNQIVGDISYSILLGDVLITSYHSLNPTMCRYIPFPHYLVIKHGKWTFPTHKELSRWEIQPNGSPSS